MSQKALKQEDFSVEEKERRGMIVQDRVAMPAGVCFLHFEDYVLKILDISVFGCALAVPSAHFMMLKNKFSGHAPVQADLFYRGHFVQHLSLSYIRDQSIAELAADQEMMVGLDIVGEPLNVEAVLTLQSASNVMVQQTLYAQEINLIPMEFRNFVYGLRDWLEKLKTRIDKLEGETPLENLQETQQYRHIIVENIADFLAQMISPLYPQIPELMKNFSPDMSQLAVRFAREQVGPLLHAAPFANRAFNKPRGYAGDFEMMNQFYRDEMVGRTLYDQCIHKYFVDEPPGAAVKNRLHYLYEKLDQLFARSPATTPLKVLSLASGPAMEQQKFLKEAKQYHGRPAEFTCLDQDSGALKHAQRQLFAIERSVHSGFQLKFVNMAIRNVIAHGFPDSGYDLIYSAGLFDYLMEPVARLAAQQMLAVVKPGAQVIIGNFSTNNPWVSFAELVLDWRLIYRSEEDLLRIFKGLGSKMWVEKEPLGINLFVVIER